MCGFLSPYTTNNTKTGFGILLEVTVIIYNICSGVLRVYGSQGKKNIQRPPLNINFYIAVHQIK